MAGLLLCQLAGAGTWGPAEAVTIYRLGGEDHASFPLPSEVADGRAGFEQLSWAHVDPAAAGASDNVNLDGALAPFYHGSHENVLDSAQERGGFLRTERYTGYGHDPDLDVVADGDFATFIQGHIASLEYSTASGTHGLTMYFDLGGLFPVNRVRVSPRPGSPHYIEHIAIATASGEPHGGTPNRSHLEFHRKLVRETPFDFGLVAEITQNKNPVVEIPLDRTPVRQLALWVDPFQREPWEIAEVEVFAEGYVPFAGYVSNTIPLGALSSLGRVRWSGRQDGTARVSIRSRGGDDPDPSRYWRRTFRSDEEVPYGADGSPLTRAQYDKLQGKEKGRITHDAESWELWSAPYPFGDSLGVAMVAPRPRTYVQFSIDFASRLPRRRAGELPRVRGIVAAGGDGPGGGGRPVAGRGLGADGVHLRRAAHPVAAGPRIRQPGAAVPGRARVEEVTGVEVAGAAAAFTEVDSLRTGDRVVVLSAAGSERER